MGGGGSSCYTIEGANHHHLYFRDKSVNYKFIRGVHSADKERHRVVLDICRRHHHHSDHFHMYIFVADVVLYNIYPLSSIVR